MSTKRNLFISNSSLNLKDTSDPNSTQLAKESRSQKYSKFTPKSYRATKKRNDFFFDMFADDSKDQIKQFTLQILKQKQDCKTKKMPKQTLKLNKTMNAQQQNYWSMKQMFDFRKDSEVSVSIDNKSQKSRKLSFIQKSRSKIDFSETKKQMQLGDTLKDYMVDNLLSVSNCNKINKKPQKQLQILFFQLSSLIKKYIEQFNTLIKDFKINIQNNNLDEKLKEIDCLKLDQLQQKFKRLQNKLQGQIDQIRIQNNLNNFKNNVISTQPSHNTKQFKKVQQQFHINENESLKIIIPQFDKNPNKQPPTNFQLYPNFQNTFSPHSYSNNFDSQSLSNKKSTLIKQNSQPFRQHSQNQGLLRKNTADDRTFLIKKIKGSIEQKRNNIKWGKPQKRQPRLLQTGRIDEKIKNFQVAITNIKKIMQV